MAEIEQFSALVADIHDASLGPSLWPGVLEKICAFVPAAVSNIFVHDGVAKHVHAGFDYGLGARSSELYLTKYARLNPMFPALLFCEVGEIFCSSNLVPAAQMAQTLFYREYLKPQGLGEAVGIVLVKSATRCVVFSVILTGALGEIEEKALERVRLLIPHVQRAACAGRPVDPPRVAAESRKTVPNPLTFPELVARHFRLTPTELAVLFWIVEVGAMAEVAKILSLELRHVQARLASTLVKTGTKDEADLIRFVAHLANPVAQ